MTQQAYILALRRLYLQLPNTHRRFSRSDRHLASILYQRGFSLDLVRSALLLATARRLAHDPAHPLPSRFLLATCNTWSAKLAHRTRQRSSLKR